MLNNKSVYFPAVSAGTQYTALKENAIHELNKKSFRFYNKEDSVFYYPNLLISAGHNYKRKTKELLQYSLDSGIIVLGDSGGFQIATGALKFDETLVHQIFNWLEENTNYAINIDIPPYVSTTREKVGDLKTCLDISIKNFEFFKKNQSGKTKYLNVLHGRSKSDLDKWYDAVKDFNFDAGWAIGSASSSLFYILQSFFYLYEKGEIQKAAPGAFFHILGFSKAKQLYFLLYLQQKLNHLNHDVKLSYDSSSPFLMAAFGGYFIFIKKEGSGQLTFSNTIIKENKYINLEAPLPCSCPICQGLFFKDLFKYESKTGFGSQFYYYTAMHNFYISLIYKDQMEKLMTCESVDIYSTVFSSIDLELFSIIDNAFNSNSPFSYIVSLKERIAKIVDEPEISKKLLF